MSGIATQQSNALLAVSEFAQQALALLATGRAATQRLVDLSVLTVGQGGYAIGDISQDVLGGANDHLSIDRIIAIATASDALAAACEADDGAIRKALSQFIR